jgi:hypothetical protein
VVLSISQWLFTFCMEYSHKHLPHSYVIQRDLVYADCIWNVMAHAQTPDFVFRLLCKLVGASVLSTTGSQGLHISGSNVGYTMFWGSVKSTGYPLHSPVSPSLPLPCITVCHHISTGLYSMWSVSYQTVNYPIWIIPWLRFFHAFSSVVRQMPG